MYEAGFSFSLKHFGHLFHINIRSCRNTIHSSVFSDDMTELT